MDSSIFGIELLGRTGVLSWIIPIWLALLLFGYFQMKKVVSEWPDDVDLTDEIVDLLVEMLKLFQLTFLLLFLIFFVSVFSC